MSFFGPNVYSHPEVFGLTLVAEINYGCDEIRAVWKDKSGLFYTARGSRYFPFQEYTDFYTLDVLDEAILEREVAEEAAKSWSFLERVRNA